MQNFQLPLFVKCLHVLCYRKFAGKTVFITGASRGKVVLHFCNSFQKFIFYWIFKYCRDLLGIGKAIALKLAKDGANIVIAAKTVDPHPKLEGTIYSAAKEGKLFQYFFTYSNICKA